MSGTTTSDAEVPPPWPAWMALAALLAAQAMGNMDNSIVKKASKPIREDLSAGGSLQAILAGYTLMFGILIVTGARLGDDKGHRRMFLSGLVDVVELRYSRVRSGLAGLGPPQDLGVDARRRALRVCVERAMCDAQSRATASQPIDHQGERREHAKAREAPFADPPTALVRCGS